MLSYPRLLDSFVFPIENSHCSGLRDSFSKISSRSDFFSTPARHRTEPGLFASSLTSLCTVCSEATIREISPNSLGASLPKMCHQHGPDKKAPFCLQALYTFQARLPIAKASPKETPKPPKDIAFSPVMILASFSAHCLGASRDQLLTAEHWLHIFSKRMQVEASWLEVRALVEG